MIRVYISGPITKGDRAHNFTQACETQAALLSAGFAPFNPMLSMKHPQAWEIDGQAWIDADLPWLEMSHAVLRLPGDSRGADTEVAHAKQHGIPIYSFASDLIRARDRGELKSPAPAVIKGDPRVARIFGELLQLHAAKQRDYGKDGDPLANIRASEDWGIPAWVGALIRAGDKVRRLRSFFETGELANEGVADSFNDLAVYAVLARILFEEAVADGRLVSKRRPA